MKDITPDLAEIPASERPFGYFYVERYPDKVLDVNMRRFRGTLYLEHFGDHASVYFDTLPIACQPLSYGLRLFRDEDMVEEIGQAFVKCLTTGTIESVYTEDSMKAHMIQECATILNGFIWRYALGIPDKERCEVPVPICAVLKGLMYQRTCRGLEATINHINCLKLRERC